MKKLILSLLVAGTAATAFAQEPHSILLYGDGTVNTTRNTDLSKNTNWDANIGIGYQFNMNWTVGLNLMWGQGVVKDSSGNKTSVNNYNAGAFARYSKYFGKSEIFFWYGQLDAGYQGTYTTYEGNPAYNKGTGVAVAITPAIGINVHHGLCLNFSVGGLGYSTVKQTDLTNATNNFNLTFGHELNVGLSKNFACHHHMMHHHEGEPGQEMNSRKAGSNDDDDVAPKPKKKQRSRDDDE